MCECPICYDREATCRFICKHAFCYQCTQQWYERGSDSCPLCRRSICFKGITQMKRLWDRRAKDVLFADLIDELADDLHTTDDITLFADCLCFMQERFNYIMSKYAYVDLDTFHCLIRFTWIGVDFMMNAPRIMFYEYATFMKYLFISNTGYGVKNNLSKRVSPYKIHGGVMKYCLVTCYMSKGPEIISDSICCAERKMIRRLYREYAKRGYTDRNNFTNWLHRKYGEMVVERKTIHGDGISLPCVLCRKAIEKRAIKWTAFDGHQWVHSVKTETLPVSVPTHKQIRVLGFALR
jgi:hypothetical protein